MSAARTIAQWGLVVFCASVLGLALADLACGVNSVADWFWGVK